MEQNSLFEIAQNHFKANRFADAEPLLNQLILRNNKNAHVFHMLGTILYDRGKFSKALRCFKRALEIDPSFTDASIGLSIILNDLGKYEEGKKVFDEAQTMLNKNSAENGDPFIEEKIALKHDELGELYFKNGRTEEALEQYKMALALSNRTAEISMKIVDCYFKQEEYNLAVHLLKKVLDEFPQFHSARIKLGKVYYDSQRIPEAITEWEAVLRKDPDNTQVINYLKLAQSIETIKYEPTL